MEHTLPNSGSVANFTNQVIQFLAGGSGLSASPMLDLMAVGQGIAIVVYDILESKYLYISPNHALLTGVADVELHTRGYVAKSERMPPNHQQLIGEIINLHSIHIKELGVGDLGRFHWNYDYHIRKDNGSLACLYQINSCFALGESENLTHVLSMCFDITHLKRLDAPSFVHFKLGTETLGMYRKSNDESLTAVKRLFTPTEQLVLDLMGKGCTTKEINKHLAGSLKTIQLHRKRLCQKTGAKDGIALVAMSKMEMW